MNQKIDDIVTVIHGFLQTAGLDVSKRKGGIRVKSGSGYPVDIFSLTSSPDDIRARIKTDESDPLRRQAYVKSTQNSLSAALKGIARVGSFRMSLATGGVYVYNSVLEMTEEYCDDEPIEICEDAIEIVDGGDSDADGTFVLEFDFDVNPDTRLKIVKSLAEEAIEKLETVDAKILRQTLDMMNLKRSSAIRLAVTRIFRSATEVAELEKAIHSEAQKIVSPEDRMELQAVKELSANGFLDPVVDLLWQEVFNGEY